MADAKKLILNSDIFTWRPLATILSDNVCSVPFAVKDKLVIGKRPGFGFIQVNIVYFSHKYWPFIIDSQYPYFPEF